MTNSNWKGGKRPLIFNVHHNISIKIIGKSLWLLGRRRYLFVGYASINMFEAMFLYLNDYDHKMKN